MGRRGNRKAPTALALTVWVNPVSVFRTVTFASGMAAPLASMTVPPRLAVVYCAVAGSASRTTVATPRSILFLRESRIIGSSRFEYAARFNMVGSDAGAPGQSAAARTHLPPHPLNEAP